MADDADRPNLDDHLGLVYREAHAVAHRRFAYGFRDPDRDFAKHFISAGFLGLAAARASFDPRLGVVFSTYAVPRIRGAILDAMREESKSRRVHQLTFAELPPDVPDAQSSTLDRLEHESQLAALDRAIASDVLTDLERQVIRWRYLDDVRQRTIAERLRVTESRVSQVLAVARRKLKHSLED